jgi:hypothetical protein
MMDSLISKDKLVKAPDTSDPISSWTDYVELLCLVADNQHIDQDQLCNIAIKSDDFASLSERKQKNRKEALTTIFKDVYDHIALRRQILGESYPFEIDEDEQLCFKEVGVTGRQKLYVLLLCASNLAYMTSITSLTSDFEVVSLLYMRSLFPGMDFKLFGSSNTNTFLQPSDIIGDAKLSDRIKSLSKFISVTYNEKTVTSLPPQNSGDGGLDIVGVKPLGDERKAIPVIFGQCACSPEQWPAKQHSISDTHWKRFLQTFETSFQRYMFIPVWYMNSEKQFENELKLSDCVIIDRLRIMRMADDSFVSKCSSL